MCSTHLFISSVNFKTDVYCVKLLILLEILFCGYHVTVNEYIFK